MLGTLIKTAYGLGQTAEGAKNAAFSLYLLFYYNQVLGLPGTQAGLALFIAVVFDAVTDPLTGSLSDRLHHRWGRRHPFMYASAVPLGVTFALLFRPPDGLESTGLFVWLLVFTVLVRASMTLYHVPHLALGAELSDDYRERTTVVAYRTAFGIAGFALAIGFGYELILSRTGPELTNGQLNPAGYPGYGLVIGAILLFSILASSAGTHSRIPRLPKPSPQTEAFSLRQVVRDYVGALARPSFRALFTGLVVFFVMRGIQDVLNLHMSTFFWALDRDEILWVQIAAVPGLILGIPFWTLVARETDKKPTFLLGITLFAVMILAPPIAKIAGAFPLRESAAYLPLLLSAAAIGSFGVSAPLVTAGSMMADIADEHELATGLRQEGVFFGALSFAVKSSSGLGTLLAGVGLDLIAFPTQATPGSVDPETVRALGILYGPGIAVLAAIAITLLARYRIDREHHARTRAALDARREGEAPG